MQRLAAAVAAAALLAGCPGRGSMIGAGTGLVVGGFSGAVAVDDDNRAPGIVGGALIGVLLGSAIGFMVQRGKETDPTPTPDGDSGIRMVSGSGDEDDDDIINRLDQCPTSPEDDDGLEDGDGCPEVGTPGDQDEDGVPDASDRCPLDVGEAGDPSGCPKPLP